MTQAMSNNALAAIDPRNNAVVHAAAGTGKTWLLVSRVIRLLLEGTKPSTILAITFTRKAAAEMRLRVNERLLAMSDASDAELAAMLGAIGMTPDAGALVRARRLYEELLMTPHELRATTFHAFCQELLARFAFEAGVPPAFEIAEQTHEIESAAWRALDGDLAGRDNDVSAAMDRLLHHLGGLENTRKALREFLSHRSDWWAYTEQDTDPVGDATHRLQAALHIDPAYDPIDAFARDAEVRRLIQSLVDGLARNTPASLAAMHMCLQQAVAATDSIDFHRLVCQALHTKEGEPRAFRIPNALAKSLGAATVEALIRQRETLLDRIGQATEYGKRRATWQRTRDWYLVGARLLQYFQNAKRLEGILDFSDLEWSAYRLLTQGSHAEWIQYKLDQRIDHLLVDEFQDTNPTQWRLLRPLLEEMMAGADERRRSAFLVGDEKQSIYGFRRADPALFTLARDWLAGHAGARVYDQHISWRSSPAVVRFVNLIFDPSVEAIDGGANGLLKNFRAHETHRQELWGHAELLPLVMRDPNDGSAPAFRDPLDQPRANEEDKRREREGDLVAQKIRSLIGRPIYRKREIRACGYGDIMILLRNRTHASAYEAALRKAGIPYAGAGRGTFLDCLEVRDIVALLRLLTSPWDNVALAHVLRSPIFDANDEDLLALATLDSTTSWYDRLLTYHRTADPIPALARAAAWLVSWRHLADRVPVHDLLDRIYFDADIPNRYQHAAPAHLRQRVSGNLTRLLHLALDADGGRFPSLARFLSRLEVLTEEDTEVLDAGGDDAGDQVRILTIHAAKGLESPVVFLVDTARDTNGNERGADALVDWPIEQPRPTDFLLLSRKSDADTYTQVLLERRAVAVAQEESNLLYVALTRAQQLLFVSGCESGRRKGDAPLGAGDASRGWYGLIEKRFESIRTRDDATAFELQLLPVVSPDTGETVNLPGYVSHGLPPTLPPSPPTATVTLTVIDPALTRPFELSNTDLGTDRLIEEEDSTPSETNFAALSTAKQRGVVIHRMLEHLTRVSATREQAKRRVWREFGTALDAENLQIYWEEACAVVDFPGFAMLFDARHYDEARNEVSALYDVDGRTITGIIDRLVIRKDRLLLVDYKTYRGSEAVDTLVLRYTPQLRLYAEGLRRLWPGRAIDAMLLFTANQHAVTVDVN